MIAHRMLLILATTLACLQAAPRPNIIFILTDDLGYGDYGVFFQNLRKTKGDRTEPWHITPQLDQMAAEGLQLRHYYCPAPVCAPSRGSLLHGVHQGHANIRDNQFDQALGDNHTLASVLRAAGYSTAAIGKWGLQGNSGPNKVKDRQRKGDPKFWPAYPTKRGFDFFHGYVRHRDGHRHYPKEDQKELWENDKEISAYFDKCFTTDLFTARAKKWIVDQKQSAPDQPFFLYLAYDTPHAILQLPPSPFPKEGLKWLGQKGKMINSAVGEKDSYMYPDYANATWDHDKNPVTPETSWPDVYQRYATNVRRIDDCVGDLIDHLKKLNIDENTLVVFTTDNGPSKESYLPEGYRPDFFNSFGPFDGIKRDVWEGGIRAGALVRWPAGTPQASVSNSPCQAHDWLATFAELAGVGAPARSDGISLVPTLTGNPGQKSSRVYVEYKVGGKTPDYPEFQRSRQKQARGQMQMIRFGDHVGVRYNVKKHAEPFEIYNVAKDPKQTKNLAKALPDLQRKMHDEVLRLRRPHPKAPRPYDLQFIPALPSMKTKPGVTWSAYQSDTPWLGKLDNLRSGPSRTAPTLEEIETSPGESILVAGYLEVPHDDTYTFHLATDGLALLRIHNATVIDAGFKTPKNGASATIKLKAGKHPFRLYRKDSGEHFSLERETHSKKVLSSIPPNMLSH